MVRGIKRGGRRAGSLFEGVVEEVDFLGGIVGGCVSSVC